MEVAPSLHLWQQQSSGLELSGKQVGDLLALLDHPDAEAV
jgi:hypothetical protein